MTCTFLKHKESSLNSREKLIQEKILSEEFTGNRIISTPGQFDEVVYSDSIPEVYKSPPKHLWLYKNSLYL